jgi:hypothetical protein
MFNRERYVLVVTESSTIPDADGRGNFQSARHRAPLKGIEYKGTGRGQWMGR